MKKYLILLFILMSTAFCFAATDTFVLYKNGYVPTKLSYLGGRGITMEGFVVSGVVTATAFSGNGSQLTSVTASYSTLSGTATNATNATNATYATYATLAGSATSSAYAILSGTSSNCSQLSNYVPYTGATDTLGMGSHGITTTSRITADAVNINKIYTTPDGMMGHVGYSINIQSREAIDINGYALIDWNDGYVRIKSGDPLGTGLSQYSGAFDANNLLANRNYLLPDNAGTLSLTSDLSNYVLKSGDTMTGILTLETTPIQIYHGLTREVLLGGGTSGALELGPINGWTGKTPYIDFHYGAGIAQDYNVRIINNSDGKISIVKAAGTGTGEVVLSVGGTIETYAIGGIKFPNATTQTSAGVHRVGDTMTGVLTASADGIMFPSSFGNGLKISATSENSAPTVVTGGTLSIDGIYSIRTFTTGGTLVISGGSMTAEVLVVAGGGGGGGDCGGGGGGAGGVIYNSNYAIAIGTYTATVGAGGAGNTGAGTNGANSAFNDQVAIGGGGGGAGATSGVPHNGVLGGSGGGGGGENGSGGGTAGGRTTGQGNIGGTGSSSSPSYTGGGGGGSSTQGVNGSGTVVGVGGTGGTYEGSTVGGGGGAGASVDGAGCKTGGLGGLGGGGNGGDRAASPAHLGHAGTANTGGGGGGGSRATGTEAVGAGGAGGSGVVIIKYVTMSTTSIESLELKNFDTLRPATDNTLSLGDTSHELKDIYIDGTANIDSLVADTAAISGGTINSTVIGSTTASSASFTTLSSTGQYTNTKADGTAPMIITSTTKVSNLNVDAVDGTNVSTLTNGKLLRYNSSGTQIENATVAEASGALSGVTTLGMGGALSGATTIGMNGALSGATTIGMSGKLTNTGGSIAIKNSAEALYLGDITDSSSWRVIRSGNNLLLQYYQTTAGGISITGGTMSIDGGSEIHTFTSTGLLTVEGTGTFEVLMVGGGGSGAKGQSGVAYGGGGGAGGVIYNGGLSLGAGTYPVVIGAGGAGRPSNSQDGLTGEATTFNSSTCAGGNGGGAHASETGGSSGAPTTYSGIGGANPRGGGGGSGGNALAVLTTQATGGAGTACSITGTSLFYAGGGGGAGDNASGTGGSGGGGNGGKAGIAPTSATFYGSGGGSMRGDDGFTSGAGYQGVVIAKFFQNASWVTVFTLTPSVIITPKLTTAQKLALSTPEAGTQVFDTDLAKMNVYTTTWETITSSP